MFAVRITRSFDELKPFFDKIVSKHPGCVLVVYQHDADDEVKRTHIHALLEVIGVSSDTLKRWVKECLGVTEFSRYDWSFTVAHSRDFITYMSKGHLEPMMLHNIGCDEVTAFRAKWVEHRVVTSQKEKREDVTTYSMAEELAKWIDMDTRHSEYDPVKGKWILAGGDEITERDIIRQCIKIHNKYRKGYCDFSLVRVIQTAYGICSKSRWNDALVEKVFEKLIPRI